MSDVNAILATLEQHLGKTPDIASDAYVDAAATVMGNVKIGPRASIWPGVVLRGDINVIEVGEGSNVQDGSVVHVADEFGAKIGKNVTVGHLAMIHACTIGDECLIGMHSTILDGAQIGEQSIVGAGALVTKGMMVPPGSLVLGSPAKVVKALSPEVRATLKPWAEKYQVVGSAHKAFWAKHSR